MTNLNFTLKSDFKDITISDYYKLQGVTDIFEVLSILSDRSIDDIKQLPINVVTELIQEIDFINSSPDQIENFEFDTLLPCGDFYLKLNGDIGNWSSGRFIDFMELVKDENALDDQIHLAIALCMDKVEQKKKWYGIKSEKVIKYSDRDIIHDSEAIEQSISIPAALTITTFFLTILDGTSSDIVDYLEFTSKILKTLSKVEKILTEHLQNQHSTQTGVGTFG